MTRIATIHDVATEAQVSISTVSNAMNRPGRVAADTRRRVLEVADKLGYVPHGGATAGARFQRRRIGVIAPFRAYSSYARRLNGILDVLSADRTESIIYDHPSASRSPSPRMSSLPFSGNLDGLIIMGVPVDDELSDRLLGHNLPTVLVDSTHPGLTSVSLDETEGSRLAAQHLVDKGFQSFVYITEGQISSQYVSQGKRRLTGFRRALTETGVGQRDIQLITARKGDTASGRQAAAVIAKMARTGRVGVLAGHDTLASGVLAGLRHLKVRVPGSVGVVGWDGGDLVEAMGLTTVHQPLIESGHIGAERLLARMKDDGTPIEQIVLQPKLAEGITT